MKSIKDKIPNSITLLRILGSIVLLFLEKFSPQFYVVFSFCGISDVLDGYLARRWKVCSEKGAFLDSVADLMFYSAMLIFVIPVMWVTLPLWVWFWVAIILATRIAAYLTAAFKYHRFACMHTYFNKLTGISVFIVPYVMSYISPFVAAFIPCVVGTISSLEELLIHLCTKEYRAERKSLLMRE